MKNLKKILKNSQIDKLIAGGSNGSIILMDLIKDQEKYVFYIYCTWRLSLKNKVITGWNDQSITLDSILVKELKKLEKDIIEEVNINLLGDFTLFLKSGKQLNVFSDITTNGGESEIEENWSICNISNNKCYNFTNQFEIVEESYSDE